VVTERPKRVQRFGAETWVPYAIDRDNLREWFTSATVGDVDTVEKVLPLAGPTHQQQYNVDSIMLLGVCSGGGVRTD